MALFQTGPLASLAPWDAASYFQMPVVVHFDLPTTEVIQLVDADPNRVLLNVLIRTSVTQVLLAPVPDNDTELFAYAVLRALSPSSDANNQLEITWGKEGPLVTSAWYIQGQIGDCIVFTTLSLTRWPDRTPLKPQTIQVPKCPPLKIV
jgi:hypothetical protein